jgi:hypothetical protein
MTAYPLGAIVGRALLIDGFQLPILQPQPHKWILWFEKPEIFPEPIPYAGHPGYFYLDPATAQRLPERYPYRL